MSSETQSAAMLRAERRRQRILQNSDDRMKKIFGGQNYHEEHLKLSSNLNENEESVVLSTPTNPQQVEPRNFPTPIQTLEAPASHVQASQKSFSWTFWLFLGMIVRLILSSSWSWICSDNALLPYFLIFISIQMFFNKQSNSSTGILDILCLFARLNPGQISILKHILSILSCFFNTFSSYLFAFVITDMIQT